jgi:hypothetical protein
MKPDNPSPSKLQLWTRPFLMTVLQAALAAEETRFVRQSTLAWLAAYPGDLPVQLARAKALIGGGHHHQALSLLQTFCQVDPENVEAQKLLSRTNDRLGIEGGEAAQGSVLALGGKLSSNGAKTASAIWGNHLQKTRKAIQKGQLKEADEFINQVLVEDPQTALMAITHLQLLRAKEDTPKPSRMQLARHYHQRWPDCLQIMLILAEEQMDCGESEQAVALLHRVASQDVTGEVATRLLGQDHPYRSLWPKNLQAYIDIPLPASISTALGWNLLPNSRPRPFEDLIDIEELFPQDPPLPPFLTIKHLETEIPLTIQDPPQSLSGVENSIEHSPGENLVEPISETDFPQSQETEKPISIQDDLEEKKQRGRTAGPDGRFPIYVVFSTKNGLHRKFGENTANILDKALRGLVASIRKRMDWGSALIYADDPGSMARFDLKPVPWNDAWKLKLALSDLDDALRKRGARIGAVLIIGGPEVVPFHNLPNPTDDDDTEVPSDNPYATRDENYFVPEWPVGRLPSGAGKEPGMLLGFLRDMTTRYSALPDKKKNWLIASWQWLMSLLRSNRNGKQISFGYSAEVWRRASISVFRPVGDPRKLITSPPIKIQGRMQIPITKLGYFNLHGVADSAEWFGQRDPADLDKTNSNPIIDSPDYPVALHPKDVVNGGRAPQLIFSEACYGANILKKSVEDALALKFLASGSQAVVGSTVISYGSIAPPLNAADLLGKSFWKFLKDGHVAGEALRRAKIHLAREMHNRQGYLDGEDQKTLISFVLYGDPLAKFEVPINPLKNHHKAVVFPEPNIMVKTICDRADIPGSTEPIPNEVMSKVKNVVEQYLPGMRGAKMSLSFEHADCNCTGHHCPTGQLGIKTRTDQLPERQVVTLSKSIRQSRYSHAAYARLTLNKEGKVVKLAVSR